MTDKTTLAKERTDQARERTDWAEDRTLLANERTFAGWLRTGMAALAVALGLQALFNSFEPTWAPKLAASVFIAAAVVIFASAAWRAHRAQKRIDGHDADAQPPRRMLVLGGVLVAGSISIGTILWFL